MRHGKDLPGTAGLRGCQRDGSGRLGRSRAASRIVSRPSILVTSSFTQPANVKHWSQNRGYADTYRNTDELMGRQRPGTWYHPLPSVTGNQTWSGSNRAEAKNEASGLQRRDSVPKRQNRSPRKPRDDKTAEKIWGTVLDNKGSFRDSHPQSRAAG